MKRVIETIRGCVEDDIGQSLGHSTADRACPFEFAWLVSLVSAGVSSVDDLPNWQKATKLCEALRVLFCGCTRQIKQAL